MKFATWLGLNAGTSTVGAKETEIRVWTKAGCIL